MCSLFKTAVIFVSEFVPFRALESQDPCADLPAAAARRAEGADKSFQTVPLINWHSENAC